MQGRKILALAIFLIIFVQFAFGDVDVSVPPGSGCDWDVGLLRPVPTNFGKVQAVNTKNDAHGASHKTAAAGSGLQIPVQNLSGYFNIQTPDIAGEVIRFNANTPGIKDKIETPGLRKSIEYPPVFPTELVWDGISTVIRIMLHPEVVNEHEAVIHFYELGVAGKIGAQMVFNNGIAKSSRSLNTHFNSKVRKNVGNITQSPPTLPSDKGYKGMLERIAVIETVNGFPGSLNPLYARKLMSMGEDAIPALIKTTKTRHTFLFRNSTFLLGGYNTPEVNDRLSDIAFNPDKVAAVRAVKGLISHGGKKAIDTMKKLLKSDDPVMRILAIYGAGKIKALELQPMIFKMMTSDSKNDYGKAVTWSGLEAIARIGNRDKKILKYLQKLLKQYTKNLPNEAAQESFDKTCRWRPRFPEVEGFLNRIMYEKTLLALAAMGDNQAKKDLLNIEILDIHAVNHFLYIDVLSNLGDDGTEKLKKLILTPPKPKMIKVKNTNFQQKLTVSTFVISAALKAIAFKVKSSFLQEVVESKKNYSIMTIGLGLLMQANKGRAKQVCTEMMEDVKLAGGELIVDIDKLTAEKARLFKIYQDKMALWRNENDPAKKADLQKEYMKVWQEYSAINNKINQLDSENSVFAKQFFASTLLDVGSQLGALDFEFVEKAAEIAFEQSAYTHRIGSNYLKEIPKVYVVPAFLECATVALGRIGDLRAIPILLKILYSGLPSGPAEAALSLANLKSKTSYVALLKALESDDGWLRFAAYQALKKLTNEEYEIDWIFDSTSHIKKAAAKYKAAILKILKRK